MPLRIVADRVIAAAATAFAEIGEVTLADGRLISAELLADADVLLVRSVTRVDAALLDGTPVRFVGTATAGTDHVDEDLLRARGIAFAAAPGCNARAVGEYVLATVLAHAERIGRAPSTLRCGVIGCGHAGRAALDLLEAVGVECLRNDPPLAAGRQGYVPLAEALAADVVSLHVPLSAGGPHPTVGLLGASELARMPRGALLINAARGGVVDEPAWQDAVAGRRLLAAIDCWRGEPGISRAMLDAAWIATPHVAGHTVDARLRATHQLRGALRAWAGVVTGNGVAPAPTAADAPAPLVLPPGATDAAVRAAVFACVDPRAQTADFRAALDAAGDGARAAFDRMRAQFGSRREFGVRPVAETGVATDTAAQLQRLGFRLVTA
jgi:erythronate-4-phosphate dehydrogenase